MFTKVRQVRAFESIIQQVEAAILKGRLAVGDRLPPERELQGLLDVSRNTLRESLRVLEQKGLIEVRKGNRGGVFVKEINADSMTVSLGLFVQSQRITMEQISEFRQDLEGENLEEAEKLIVRAMELKPNDGAITDSLGWVYYMRARPLLAQGNVREARLWLDRAIDELERAAKLTGGDPVISEHLGDVHLALGEKKRALEYYEEAVQLEPRPEEHPDLHQKLGRLREELKRR